jgi:hypothetical protein
MFCGALHQGTLVFQKRSAVGHLNEVTIGLHVKGTLPAEFDYDTEFDGQKGSLGVYSIGAWAGYVGLGKTFREAAAAPRVFIEGNYASGTKNPAGRDWNTFDSLYPSDMERPVNYELRFIFLSSFFLFPPGSSAGRDRGSYNDD